MKKPRPSLHESHKNVQHVLILANINLNID